MAPVNRAACCRPSAASNTRTTPSFAARRHPRAVGTEGDRSQHSGVVYLENPLAARGVTDAQPTLGRGAVGKSPGGGQPAAVGRPAERVDPAALPEDRPLQPLGPSSHGRTSSPRSSARPTAIRVPSGLQATNWASCAIRAVSRPVSGIPDSEYVPRGAGEPPAVRAPAEPRVAVPRSRALTDGPELPPALGVPDPDRPLIAEGRQSLAVGPERDGPNAMVVPDQLVPDPAIRQADQVGRNGRTLAAAVGGPATDRQEVPVGADGDATGLRGGGQGDGPQLGVGPLVEVRPLPAAAVGLAGPGSAQVQQAAGRGGVVQAEGALGLADPGAVEALLGPLALAIGLAALSLDLRQRGLGGQLRVALAAAPRGSLTFARPAIRPATSTEAIVAPISTAVSTPPRLATAGWRRAQRSDRSAAPARRARIGSSSRNRRRSSAIASAVA